MKKVIQIAKNKYLLVGLFFILWMAFFDQNDLMSRRALDKEIETLESDQKFFLSETEKLKKVENRLLEDEDAIEKYAREHFYMKKKDEDVFVFVD